MWLVGFCEVIKEEEFNLVVIIDEVKVVKKYFILFIMGLEMVKKMKIGIWVVRGFDWKWGD